MQDNSEVATGKKFLYFREKNLHDKEDSTRSMEEEKYQKEAIYPQNRITDKPGKLGMSKNV